VVDYIFNNVNDNVDVSVGSLNGAQNEVMHDAADLGLLDVAIICRALQMGTIAR